MSIDRANELNEMAGLNEAQAKFYETGKDEPGNLATRVWRNTARNLWDYRMALGIDDQIYALHWDWMGDLAGKRVLDLGCHAGNALSLDIAERSGFYLGVDLSRPAIAKLKGKLEKRRIPHADAIAMDFLSPDFPETDFDVCYAFSVAHHFKHFDAFLRLLKSRLVPGGKVITYDPLQTSVPVRLARMAYRPFQTDRDWEWPFDRDTFDMIQRHFEITGLQGVLGQAKQAMPLSLVSPGRAATLGRRWHARDMQRANRIGRPLWGCMHVAMCWVRR